MTATDHVVVFDEDRDRASAIAGLLAKNYPEPRGPSIATFLDLRKSGESAERLLEHRGGSMILAVVVEADPNRTTFPGLAAAARRQGVTTLAVVDGRGNPATLVERIRGFDDWVSLDAIDHELPCRVTGLLDSRQRSSKPGGSMPVIDPKFLALVVHDLRTPLNVIGLTIRAITQTMPDRSAELDEDLTFLKENAGQIEKMLAQLGDYCRLIEGESQVSGVEFDPKRFLTDFLEVHRSRPGSNGTPVRLELAENSPVEVTLDPSRVKLALQHALANAVNAAGKTPVRLRSSGGPDRWILELIVDKPPPQTVVSTTLRPDVFERLAGSAAERRGLDLAIVSSISHLFGGTTRLVVDPDRRSSIILDWPRQLSSS